jgi:hypothetical protein
MLQVFFQMALQILVEQKLFEERFIKKISTISKNILSIHCESRSLSKASIKSIKQECLIYVSQDKLVQLFCFGIRANFSNKFTSCWCKQEDWKLKVPINSIFFCFFCWKILNLRDINIQAKIYNGSEHILPSNCHHIKYNSFSSATMEFFFTIKKYSLNSGIKQFLPIDVKYFIVKIYFVVLLSSFTSQSSKSIKQ